MGITGPEFKDWSKGGVLVTAQGEMCFFCGKACYDAGWVWSGFPARHGFPAEIYLHMSCALQLGIQIMANVREYQKKEGKTAKTT